MPLCRETVWCKIFSHVECVCCVADMGREMSQASQVGSRKRGVDEGLLEELDLCLNGIAGNSKLYLLHYVHL